MLEYPSALYDFTSSWSTVNTLSISHAFKKEIVSSDPSPITRAVTLLPKLWAPTIASCSVYEWNPGYVRLQQECS